VQQTQSRRITTSERSPARRRPQSALEFKRAPTLTSGRPRRPRRRSASGRRRSCARSRRSTTSTSRRFRARESLAV
jgi:hypothetical protein